MVKICFIGNRIKAKIKTIFYIILIKTTKKKMVIDITGTLLIPGNFGEDCKLNGSHLNYCGKLIECYCDECDYMMCCLDEHIVDKCLQCTDKYCPRSKNKIIKTNDERQT